VPGLDVDESRRELPDSTEVHERGEELEGLPGGRRDAGPVASEAAGVERGSARASPGSRHASS
jgi:hypothetical protein